MAQTLAAPSTRRGEDRDGGVRCQVWGVLNVTPDSFSDGGAFLESRRALEHAQRMLDEGADVIDVGGASSRPRGALYGEGAAPVSAAEEQARVLPVVESLAARGVCVSIDTTKAEVARGAIAAGARIVNDVSCGASAELLALLAEHAGVDCVLMHTRGEGQVAPPYTDYGDVVGEVLGELLEAVARAQAAGVARERLWIDPGLGFAKTAAQSAALLAGTDMLCAAGLRVLCGPSRKGFIAELAPGRSGQRPVPSARVPGTLAAVTIAAWKGAHAVRVHDVAEARQAVLLTDAIRRHAGPPC